MCGIIGYIGNNNCILHLTNGLKRLEYRGYDSAGIAIINNKELKVYKEKGKLQNLINLLNEKRNEMSNSNIGIGHIRWATHGIPNEINAHPHTTNFAPIAIVHNGIIENYKELKEDLITKGAIFKSETDTEVIAHLIGYEYTQTKDLKTAVINATKQLKGAYALCIINENNPNEIIATKRFAPLIIGKGNNENIIGSDIPAIINITNKVIYLDDNETAIITKEDIKVYDSNNNIINKNIAILNIKEDNLNKDGYKHFMLKEINEQPNIIRNLINSNIVKERIKNLPTNINNIKIIACGTSLHAGIIAKYIIEDITSIPVETESASEYIYRKNTTNKNSLVIGISQSGETADTITALRQAKEKNATTIIITNREDSSICKYGDYILPINAGIEISVAATKSYTAQLITLYLLSIHLSELENKNDIKTKELKSHLNEIPNKMEQILNNTNIIENIAIKLSAYKDFIFISRGTNIGSSMEGALKLKEISYINATAYPAGELKHGPIALLDENIPLIAILIPNHITYDKLISNCQEAKARKAKLIAITSSNDETLTNLFDYIIQIPEISENVSPLITCIPLQLIAYYIANFLGKDVDQPRNLAKSVTVE